MASPARAVLRGASGPGGGGGGARRPRAWRGWGQRSLALKWLLQAPEARLGRGCRPASPSAPRCLRAAIAPGLRGPGPGAAARPPPGRSRADGAAVAPGFLPAALFSPEVAAGPGGPCPARCRSRSPGPPGPLPPERGGTRVLLCAVSAGSGAASGRAPSGHWGGPAVVIKSLRLIDRAAEGFERAAVAL